MDLLQNTFTTPDHDCFSRAAAFAASAERLRAGAFRASVLHGWEDDDSLIQDRLDALDQAEFDALPAWARYEIECEQAWQQHAARQASVIREAVAAALDAQYPALAQLIEAIHRVANYPPSEVRLVREWERRIDAAAAPRLAALDARRRALVPMDQVPCRALVPLTHYIDPTPALGGLRFAARGTSESYPTWSACRWTTDFLGGTHQWLA